MVRVLGGDISLNHGAYVLLDDGELADCWYYTDIAGAAARSRRGHRLVLPKTDDVQTKNMARLAWLEAFFAGVVLARAHPDYVGFEDYALDGGSAHGGHGAHAKGEIGGIAKIHCWHRGYSLRLHDPLTLKMWTAHNGRADKPMMEAAVRDRWGVDFSTFNPPVQARKGKQSKENRQTSEDLADAFAVAKLVWLEVQLRSGHVQMSELPEKEIRVFNRVTKSYPVNVLARDWIKNPGAVIQ